MLETDRRLMEFRGFKDYDLIHARIDDSRILLTDYERMEWNAEPFRNTGLH